MRESTSRGYRVEASVEEGSSRPEGADRHAPRTVPLATGRAPVVALDGLRGLAVLAVMLFHFQIFLDADAPRIGLLRNGWFGVDVFFALSGFLITKSLRERLGTDRYWRTFYIRRAIRILPVYALFLVVMFPVILDLHPTVPAWSFPLFISNYWLALTATPLVLTVTWSLAIEEQFYLVWPSIVRWLSWRRMVRLCLLIASISPFVRWYLHSPDNAASYMWTVGRLDGLAWGALAWLFHERKPLESTRLARKAVLPGALALAVLLSNDTDLRTQIWFAGLGFTALSVVSAATILVLVADDRATPSRLLAAGPLPLMGRISYPAYLFHPIAGLLTLQFSSSLVLGLALPTVATFAVSLLIHRTIEQPTMRLKTSLAP